MALDFSSLNSAQQLAIADRLGPKLIIAGPGSGKTFCLVLRTLNLLLQELAEPEQIIV